MTEMTDHERQYPRKVFCCRAALSMEHQSPIEVSTADISLGGIGLTLIEPIDPGQYGVVKFDAFVNGNSHPFSAIVKAIYNVPSSTGQYRTGFQFFELDAANAAIIHELVG